MRQPCISPSSTAVKHRKGYSIVRCGVNRWMGQGHIYIVHTLQASYLRDYLLYHQSCRASLLICICIIEAYLHQRDSSFCLLTCQTTNAMPGSIGHSGDAAMLLLEARYEGRCNKRLQQGVVHMYSPKLCRF